MRDLLRSGVTILAAAAVGLACAGSAAGGGGERPQSEVEIVTRSRTVDEIGYREVIVNGRHCIVAREFERGDSKLGVGVGVSCDWSLR